MGAAEWTGYTNAPTYTAYSTNAAALPQPPPPATTASTYGYDSGSGMADHHSNFHIPTGNFGISSSYITNDDFE